MPDVDRINRTASDDGGDHIGYETPQSGVATPQPDLRDKRLPGIMSYFSQVRRDAPSTPHAASSETTTPTIASASASASASNTAATPSSSSSNTASSYFALKSPPISSAAAEPFHWPAGRRHMASRSLELPSSMAPPALTAANARPTLTMTSGPVSDDGGAASASARGGPGAGHQQSSASVDHSSGGGSGYGWGGGSSSGGGGFPRHSYFLTPPTSLPSSSVSSPVHERRNPFWSVGDTSAAWRDPDAAAPPPPPLSSTPGLDKSSQQLQQKLQQHEAATGSSSGYFDGVVGGSGSGGGAGSHDRPSIHTGAKGSKSMPNSTRNSTSVFRTQTPQPGQNKTEAASGRWYTLEGLKELTRGLIKSGPPTPTRALSTAQPSQAEVSNNTSSHANELYAATAAAAARGARPGVAGGRGSNDEPGSGTQTPRGPGPTGGVTSAAAPSGAQAPAPKGKLTIKIPEARGLRKSRDPYVVVVFQRSELISSSPQSMEAGETLSPASAAGAPLGSGSAAMAIGGGGSSSGLGGVPIQRQGSDNGPPPMSIPMRSRQSSNTSITNHDNTRSRPSRVSFTNPKWDAEAVL